MWCTLCMCSRLAELKTTPKQISDLDVVANSSRFLRLFFFLPHFSMTRILGPSNAAYLHSGYSRRFLGQTNDDLEYSSFFCCVFSQWILQVWGACCCFCSVLTAYLPLHFLQKPSSIFNYPFQTPRHPNHSHHPTFNTENTIITTAVPQTTTKILPHHHPIALK